MPGFPDKPPEPVYWERVIHEQQTDASAPALWRIHSDDVNGRLVRRWCAGRGGQIRMLKTDLFDEAVGAGLYPDLGEVSRHVVGIDLSLNACKAAHSRHPALAACVADVRTLPFPARAFDIIVSNSTLDHFPHEWEITRSLTQLSGVLREGGLLIITLDNPWNPAVWARARLPFSTLRRWGLVPYFVGATLSVTGLTNALRTSGFSVLDTTATLHCPRFVVIALARLMNRSSGRFQRRFLAVLRAFEGFERTPLRYLTGHFVAAAAVKQHEGGME